MYEPKHIGKITGYKVSSHRQTCLHLDITTLDPSILTLASSSLTKRNKQKHKYKKKQIFL